MMARRDPKGGANRLVRDQTLQKQQRAPVGPRAPLPDEEDPKVRLALESFGYRGGRSGRVSHGPQRLGWIPKSYVTTTRVAFPSKVGLAWDLLPGPIGPLRDSWEQPPFPLRILCSQVGLCC